MRLAVWNQIRANVLYVFDIVLSKKKQRWKSCKHFEWRGLQFGAHCAWPGICTIWHPYYPASSVLLHLHGAQLSTSKRADGATDSGADWMAATHKLAIWLDPVPRVRATQYRTAGCPTTSIRWFRARKLLSRSRELEKLDAGGGGGCCQRCLEIWALVFARFHKKHINSNWQQLHWTARWAFSGSSRLTHSMSERTKLETSVWESDELAKEKKKECCGWGPSARFVCLSTRGKCTKGNIEI